MNIANRISISNTKPKIVVFSPVRLSSYILKEALHELSLLKSDSLTLEFWFYDDNDDPDSSKLLRSFSHPKAVDIRILPSLDLSNTEYIRSDLRHHWKSESIHRIIQIKNSALQQFLATSASALFLVDSDICLHPQTLDHLHSLDLPIVSEVFWTKWRPDTPDLPNVWDTDEYTHFSAESIIRLREPGQYQVGGLGACTLVKREVVESDVSFSLIDNLSFWGEDRHFCVRARSHGFDLYADTVYPPLHVYRESQVADIERWRQVQYDRSFFVNSLDTKWEELIINRFNTPQKPKTGNFLAELPKRMLRRMRYALGSFFK